MAEPDFKQVQRAFAAHIRNPQLNAAPADVEPRRMAIYNDLFCRNIEGFISGAFPVLRSIMPDEPWHAMVRLFMTTHYCQTPYFLEISQEFLQWLAAAELDASYPSFILELAHYEWVELALDVADETPAWEQIDPNGDLLTGCPVVSPLAWSLAYQYPVQLIGPDFQPLEPSPEPTYLVVYRNRADEVKFMQGNAATAMLLDTLAQQPTPTGLAAIEKLAVDMDTSAEQLMSAGQEILQKLQSLGVIVGVWRK
ncbi:MAG: putative DNA-binding domain-containing protein [Pseudomonadales bacterium]